MDVRCPACGAPMRIDPRVASARCGHCRVESRVERVASPAEVAAPGGERVIRVVVRKGASLAGRTLLVAAALVAALVIRLAGDALQSELRPGVEADARLALELGQSESRLDSYAALTVLRDGTVVVGSSSGRLAFVGSDGTLRGTLDLPLPASRARLAGLAADRAGGFHVSLGGAILYVAADRSVGPPRPAEAEGRIFGAIALDPSGQLHAITADGRLARLGPDARPTAATPLGLPAYVRPLDLREPVFTPDGRALVRKRYGEDAVWVDPARSIATPFTFEPPGVESTIVCLPDGSLVFDTRSGLVRRDPDGRASTLSVVRPSHLRFDSLALTPEGGMAALSLSGTLVVYGPERLRP